MWNEIVEALQFDFMQNALMAGLLVSLACGIIGTFVVIDRIVFISGGIAHTAYGGVGLGYFFGIDPVVGAIAFSLTSALAMGWVERKTQQRSDTLIGVMWAVGMAIGIIFIDLTPGYKADLISYLFGSLLTVPRQDLWLMLAIDLVVLVVAIAFYKELLAISFDPVFATTRNVPVNALYLLLMGAIALTVVVVMQVVGLILTIALLSLPAATAGLFVKDVRQMMLLAVGFGILFTTAGLALSYAYNLTSGATIIVVAGTIYLASLAFSRWRDRPLLSN